MSHSEHFGTEHRGQIVTSLHGLPVTFEPAQSAVFSHTDQHAEPTQAQIRRGGRPEAQHVGDTIPYSKHRPGAVHRVYGDGRVLHDVPTEPRHPIHGYRCIRRANALARAARKAGMSDVTVDAWMPERFASNGFDTMPDDRAIPSVYQEALAASGITPDGW